jgi:hypothetical protein
MAHDVLTESQAFTTADFALRLLRHRGKVMDEFGPSNVAIWCREIPGRASPALSRERQRRRHSARR